MPVLAFIFFTSCVWQLSVILTKKEFPTLPFPYGMKYEYLGAPQIILV